MASVAIIHAAEDTLPARALAEKLRLAKLTVVLEKTPGEEQRNAAKEAKVAVVLWSPRSVAQPALVEDATFARGKTKLVHASMQNAALPDAFRSDKAVNLTGWRGEDDFAAWRELAKLVTERAGVAPLPPPAPKPPSGFFQPGAVRDAPAGGAAAPQRQPQRAQQAPRPAQQQAPRPAPVQRTAQAQRAAPPADTGAERKGGGGMMIAAIVFVVVALAGGGGYWFWSQQQSAQSTSAAWDGVDTGSADALRAFIAGDPGEYREEAQQALAALEDRTYEAASDTDTIEAIEAFLNDFPESEHALAARGRIAELQAMPPTPVEAETPLEAPPEAVAPNPDLVPPGSVTPAPDAGGPAPLTPPAPAEQPTPPPEQPTN